MGSRSPPPPPPVFDVRALVTDVPAAHRLRRGSRGIADGNAHFRLPRVVPLRGTGVPAVPRPHCHRGLRGQSCRDGGLVELAPQHVPGGVHAVPCDVWKRNRRHLRGGVSSTATSKTATSLE